MPGTLDRIDAGENWRNHRSPCASIVERVPRDRDDVDTENERPRCFNRRIIWFACLNCSSGKICKRFHWYNLEVHRNFVVSIVSFWRFCCVHFNFGDGIGL